jgi:hypothetical protein
MLKLKENAVCRETAQDRKSVRRKVERIEELRLTIDRSAINYR